MIEKLDLFISDLIEFRFDQLKFDIYKKRNKEYYSLSIDTGITSSSFGLSIFTNFITFTVCPQTNDVFLDKTDLESVCFLDESLCKKYSEIIKKLHKHNLDRNIKSIIDSSYLDLKINRDSNIRKLIG